MLGVESLERTFREHAHRRAAGKPTPIVLVGAPVIDAWTRTYPAIRSSATTAEHTIRSYVTAPTVRRLLGHELRRRIAPVRGNVPSIEQTRSEQELWTSVTGDALLRIGDVDGQLVVEHSIRSETAAPLRVLAAAARVLAAQAPALLLEPTDLDAGIRVAIAVTEAATTIPVAVAATSEAWTLWQAAPQREHAKAIVCDCVLPDEQARAFVAAEDAARSAAERALFEALESHPRSRGLFVLNHDLTVRFGSRALEIDLACPSLRIAVEVDGYFHFQDAEAYRRDRRKDVALQREAWFVVRVLAEDVMARLDDAVAAIHETIAFISERKSR